jgi:hypothetical protein
MLKINVKIDSALVNNWKSVWCVGFRSSSVISHALSSAMAPCKYSTTSLKPRSPDLVVPPEQNLASIHGLKITFKSSTKGG